MLGVWREALPQLRHESPFKLMIEEMMEPITKMYTNVSNPTLRFDEKVHARKATVAEKVAIEGREVSYRMTHLGGLTRALDAELNQEGNSALEKLRDEVYDKLCGYDRLLHENFSVTLNPIKNNVGMGVSSILHSAMYARGRQP